MVKNFQVKVKSITDNCIFIDYLNHLFAVKDVLMIFKHMGGFKI